MSDDHPGNDVVEFAGSGFVALWRGQYVQGADGGLHYFATERGAWKFLELCDTVNGTPTPPPRRAPQGLVHHF